MLSIAEIWDRFWWSLMITIFIGLVWLKFLDPYIACAGVGILVSVGAGLVYFFIGLRKMILEKRLEKEIERRALEDA
jgi:sensor c-di-GMP phosphodiesterase-like protein